MAPAHCRKSSTAHTLRTLARQFPNFTFHLALSEPQPADNWQSHTGFIHEVLQAQYLATHPDPTAVEYYLCGPPFMVAAARQMLKNCACLKTR